MSSPSVFDDASDAAPAATTRERKVLARRVLLDALFLGGLADSLLHQGLGVGLFLWMVVFAAITVHLARSRAGGMRREQAAWLGAAVFFAACFAWRDSSELLFFDFVAMVGALLLCAATLSPASPMRSILGQRVSDLARALARTFGATFTNIVPALRESEIGSPRSWRAGRTGTVLRAVLLALPIVLLFGVLFEAADPLFGAVLALPKIDFGEVASHLVVAATAAWFVGGGLRRAFGDGEAVAAVPKKQILTLGRADVTAILGGVVALFALFVGVQIEWLFGGERLVRSTTGLGYAQYARHGFFELVWASLLTLPVLLGTRALIPDSDGAAVRRHRYLATPLLVLVAGVMASALGRMALYVHYYGPSLDRLYASVFMLWLAIVFAWFGLTVLRGRTRDFVAGLAITGFVTLGALNLANPDALVARANVGRAGVALQLMDTVASGGRAAAPSGRSTSPIDYSYLVRGLGGEAVEPAVGALVSAPVAPVGSEAREAEVRARCDAVRSLFARRLAAPTPDWRTWSMGAWRARQTVHQREQELRAVTCWDNGGERPFGNRDRRAAARGEQGYQDPNAH